MMIQKTVNAQSAGLMLPVFFLIVLLFSGCPQSGDNGPELPGLNPPAAPEQAQLTPGNKRLVASWAAVDGADSYEVFCAAADAEPGTDAAPPQTVNVPMAAITGLVNGTAYHVRLRAKNSAGLSGFSPSVSGTPAVQVPAPSVIRGDEELSVGWAAEDGIEYEVWYGNSDDRNAAVKWNETITREDVVAGTVITGLSNKTYVWIKSTAGTVSAFSGSSAGTPEAPKSAPKGFVYVPGGTVTGSASYAMTVTVPEGSGYNQSGVSSVHKGVFVEGRSLAIESFFIAKYEVTRQIWSGVQTWAEENGYTFQNKITAPNDSNKNKPITNISWRDAIVWCNAYSEKKNLDPVYRDSNGKVIRDSRNDNASVCDSAAMDKSKNGFRLPTEVEREFAARGGDPGKEDWMFTYAGSNAANEVAWHHGNAPFKLQDVGTTVKPNRLGVYDLSGNAQEWGWDWMYYGSAVTPETKEDGAERSGKFNQKPMAGGGVGSNITLSCVAYRWGFTPNYTDNYLGFRLVRKAE